jgi:uncharacterized membrane protein (DUF2068 family)
MRPLGITLLSILMIAGGIFLLLSGVSMVTMKEILLPLFSKEYRLMINQTLNQSLNQTLFPLELQGEMLEVFYSAVAAIAITVGVIYTITGLGLWSLKEWARILTVILSGLGVLYSLIGIFFDPLLLIQLTVNLIIIWYLMRRDIREAFGKKMSIEERILGEKL